MYIESTNNKIIKNYKKLNKKKYRDLTSTFIVEGEHLIEEAFKNKVLLTLLTHNNLSYECQIYNVPKNILKELSNLNTVNNIGICQIQEGKIKGNLILYLDNIQDPGNLGTIIRSASAFNVDTIILNNCVDLYNPKVIRATQGLIFNTNIILNYDLNKLKDYTIYGTDVNQGLDLKKMKFDEKIIIAMGNEGNGISLQTKHQCNEFINIKTNPKCESLNVAIATSLILYEVNK